MAYCKKPIYKNMCEADSGIRHGKTKKVAYESRPKRKSKPKTVAKTKAKATAKPLPKKGRGNVTINKSVRAWYMETYPADSLGVEIIPRMTFEHLRKWINRHTADIYDLLEVQDSVVGNRVMEKMSQLYNVPYNVVYEAGFGHGNIPPKRKVRA